MAARRIGFGDEREAQVSVDRSAPERPPGVAGDGGPSAAGSRNGAGACPSLGRLLFNVLTLTSAVKLATLLGGRLVERLPEIEAGSASLETLRWAWFETPVAIALVVASLFFTHRLIMDLRAWAAAEAWGDGSAGARWRARLASWPSTPFERAVFVWTLRIAAALAAVLLQGVLLKVVFGVIALTPWPTRALLRLWDAWVFADRGAPNDVAARPRSRCCFPA